MKFKMLLKLSGISKDHDRVIQELQTYLKSDDSFSSICEYLNQDYGKCVRSTLMLLWYRAIDPSLGLEKFIHLASAVELIHLASLIHDDVIDEADKRRGLDSIRALYGDKTALLAGIYVYAISLEALSKVDSVYVGFIGQMVRQLSSGEYLQLKNRNHFFSTIEDYLDMIHQKTSVLFSISLKSTAMMANEDSVYTKTAEDFGAAFGAIYQITDDVLDIYGDYVDLGKQVGQDLEMGDTNFPIQLAYHFMTDPEKDMFKSGFSAENVVEIQKYLQQYKTQIIEFIDDLIQKEYQKARSCIQILPDSSYKDGIDKILETVMQRYQHQVLEKNKAQNRGFF